MSRATTNNWTYMVSNESKKKLENKEVVKTDEEVEYTNTNLTFTAASDVIETAVAAVTSTGASTTNTNLTFTAASDVIETAVAAVTSTGASTTNTNLTFTAASDVIETAVDAVTSTGASTTTNTNLTFTAASDVIETAVDAVTSNNRADKQDSEEIFTKFEVPQVLIKRIILDQQAGKKISEIKFGFKIAYDRSKNKILEKYRDDLQINVIEIKDENLFSFVNLSKEILWYVANPQKLKSLPQIILNVSKNIGLTDNATIAELKKIFMDKKYVNIKTLMPRDMVAVARIEEDARGNNVINFEYNKKFENELATRHLSYFVYADLNEEALREKNINEGIQVSDIRMASELVINNGKTLRHTFAYYLTNPITRKATIWTDFKHYDPDRGAWYTGKFTDKKEQKKKLKIETLYNTKIKDYTIFSRLEGQIGKSDKNSEKVTRGISPLRMEGTQGQSIIFHANTELLLEKHSPLYPYINLLNLKNSNIIKDVRVFKKRVKESKKTEYMQDFYENQQQIYLNNPTKIIDRKNEINRISVVDNEVKTGPYCYGIEVYFSDVLKEYLETDNKNLAEVEKFFLEYYRDSMISRHHYDAENDGFTNKFKTKYKEETRITRGVEMFFELYNKIVGTAALPEDAKSQIVIHVSPKTGNPTSIMRFGQTIGILKKYYYNILKQTSNIALYKEIKYFNSFQEVVEFKKAPTYVQISSNFFENFFNKNNLVIEKKQADSYVSVEKNSVWENMDILDKFFLKNWITSAQAEFLDSNYISQEDKYEKAISLSRQTEGVVSQDMIESENFNKSRFTKDFFLTTVKSGIEEEEAETEDTVAILSSVNYATTEFTSNNNISDLKISDIFSSTANTFVRG